MIDTKEVDVIEKLLNILQDLMWEEEEYKITITQRGLVGSLLNQIGEFPEKMWVPVLNFLSKVCVKVDLCVDHETLLRCLYLFLEGCNNERDDIFSSCVWGVNTILQTRTSEAISITIQYGFLEKLFKTDSKRIGVGMVLIICQNMLCGTDEQVDEIISKGFFNFAKNNFDPNNPEMIINVLNCFANICGSSTKTNVIIENGFIHDICKYTYNSNIEICRSAIHCLSNCILDQNPNTMSILLDLGAFEATYTVFFTSSDEASMIECMICIFEIFKYELEKFTFKKTPMVLANKFETMGGYDYLVKLQNSFNESISYKADIILKCFFKERIERDKLLSK